MTVPSSPETFNLLTAALADRYRVERELGRGGMATVTARLQHPHILPVHDSGEAAGRLWYTMPYVEGESLRQREVPGSVNVVVMPGIYLIPGLWDMHVHSVANVTVDRSSQSVAAQDWHNVEALQ